MEDLLTPQICMDVDDTPLDVGKDSTDEESDTGSTSSDENDDSKVRQLLELEFKHPAQVPENLTEAELEAKKNVLPPGELTVEYQRLHCTACNIHLGSAPIGYFNRYIHPLLKVLVCKSCYDFYCSGEFDKDEDGSELYCRWCGQGGKVMCCAQCAYVFCQKCVRQNLGKKRLEMIKDSDDWLCFGCNPIQLIHLKIICASLYDFTQEEIRLAKALSNVERLKVDHSVCCSKTRTNKRRRDQDETYNPYLDEDVNVKRSKFSGKGNKPEVKKWLDKTEKEEVICAPDVSTLVQDKQTPQNTNIKKPIVLPKLQMPSKPLYICSSSSLPSPSPSPTFKQNSNVIRVQSPAIKLVAPTNPTTTVPLLTSIPVHLIPGSKHEWFEKAATVVSTITGSLSFTLDTLTNELKGSKTVENLATVHNKLQELLSTSINSLIQVRRSLRNQFLEDLNHLKFTAQKNQPLGNLPLGNLGSNTLSCVQDDDDVVIVKSNLTPKDENVRNNGRPYLKVRSVSQLLKVPAECITIPDDPPKKQEGLKIRIKSNDELLQNENLKDKNLNLNVNQKSNKEGFKETMDEIRKDIEDFHKIDDHSEIHPELLEKLEGEEDLRSVLTETQLDSIIKNNTSDMNNKNNQNKQNVGNVRNENDCDCLINVQGENNDWFDDIEDHLECAIVPNFSGVVKNDNVDDKNQDGGVNKDLEGNNDEIMDENDDNMNENDDNMNENDENLKNDDENRKKNEKKGGLKLKNLQNDGNQDENDENMDENDENMNENDENLKNDDENRKKNEKKGGLKIKNLQNDGNEGENDDGNGDKNVDGNNDENMDENDENLKNDDENRKKNEKKGGLKLKNLQNDGNEDKNDGGNGDKNNDGDNDENMDKNAENLKNDDEKRKKNEKKGGLKLKNLQYDGNQDKNDDGNDDKNNDGDNDENMDETDENFKNDDENRKKNKKKGGLKLKNLQNDGNEDKNDDGNDNKNNDGDNDENMDETDENLKNDDKNRKKNKKKGGLKLKNLQNDDKNNDDGNNDENMDETDENLKNDDENRKKNEKKGGLKLKNRQKNENKDENDDKNNDDKNDDENMDENDENLKNDDENDENLKNDDENRKKNEKKGGLNLQNFKNNDKNKDQNDDKNKDENDDKNKDEDDESLQSDENQDKSKDKNDLNLQNDKNQDENNGKNKDTNDDKNKNKNDDKNKDENDKNRDKNTNKNDDKINKNKIDENQQNNSNKTIIKDINSAFESELCDNSNKNDILKDANDSEIDESDKIKSTNLSGKSSE